MQRKEVMVQINSAKEKAAMQVVEEVLHQQGISRELCKDGDDIDKRSKNERARKPIDNFEIAKLWYLGLSPSEISRKLDQKLTSASIVNRLKKMNIYE